MLLNWCRRYAGGYNGVWIENFSKSFRDGLAFCAIIHSYKHSLIPWETLKAETEEDMVRNHQLAFDAAEKTWGVTKLLDPEDMLAGSEPDKLSVMTYISEMYKFMKEEIAEGNPFESNLLLQMAEQTKKRKEEEKERENSFNSPIPKRDTPEVKKMSLGDSAGSLDPSSSKGCGKCQQINSFPGCSGFSPESFRKTRCQHCFHSLDEHAGFVSEDEKEEAERSLKEKEEADKILKEKALRRRAKLAEKKKQILSEKSQEILGQKKQEMERELKEKKEAYQRAVEERRNLERQREKDKFAREEKLGEAKRNKRTLQRQLDRKGSTMDEEEKKKLEADIESYRLIEEELKDPLFYEDLPPLEEPPSSLEDLTLADNDITIEQSSIILSDDELNDPELDKVDIGDISSDDLSSASPVSRPVKQVSAPKTVQKSPVKKQPIKKQAAKKAAPKKVEPQKPKAESPEKVKPKAESPEKVKPTTTKAIPVSGDDKEVRRQLRLERRYNILQEHKRPESILSLVAKKKNL